MAEVFLIQINSTANKALQRKASSKNALLTLTEIAEKVYGKNKATLSVSRTENGKPYFKDLNDLHFSISHCENKIAIAFSKKPIGVDIERIRKPDLRVAKRFFEAAQIAYINELPELSSRRFFEVWTYKEAFIKKNGLTLKALKTAPIENIFTAEHEGFLISVCLEKEENVEIIPYSVTNT